MSISTELKSFNLPANQTTTPSVVPQKEPKLFSSFKLAQDTLSPSSLADAAVDFASWLPKQVYDRLAGTPERVKGYGDIVKKSVTENPIVQGGEYLFDKMVSNYKNDVRSYATKFRDEKISSAPRQYDQFGLPKAELTTPKSNSEQDILKTLSPQEIALAQGEAGASLAAGFVGGGETKIGKEVLKKMGKKEVLDLLSKTENPAGVEKILTDIGYQPELIPKVKDIVAKETRPNFIEATLEGFDKALPKQKIVPEGSILEKTSAVKQKVVDEYNRTSPDAVPLAESTDDLKTVMKKTFTDPVKKVNWVDIYLNSPQAVLEKIGLPKLWSKIEKGYDSYVRELPENLKKIQTWAKEVAPESNLRIFQALDGKPIELNQQESKVAGEIRSWLNEFADRQKLKPNERITNYITHLFEGNENQPIPDEMTDILTNTMPDEVYSGFLKERTGATGYLQDTWKALEAYAKVSTRKIHMDEPLQLISSLEGKLEDSQNKFIKRLSDNINLRPTDGEISVDNWLNGSFAPAVESLLQVFSPEKTFKFSNRPFQRGTSALRKITSAAKLGFSVSSAFKNLTQGINTFSELGTEYTLKGYTNLIARGKNGVKELVDNGVLQDAFAIENSELRAMKRFWYYADRATFLNFELTELINRGSAYFGAKSKALASGLNEEEAISYAKNMAEKTQFKFGSIHTPVGLNSSVMKTLFQFQTYNVKQIEFIRKMIRERNYAAIARYMAGTTAIFGTVGKSLGMSPADMLPTIKLFGDYLPPSLDFPFQVGSNVFSGKDKYGNEQTVGERIKNVGDAAVKDLIPGGVQLRKTYQGLKQTAQGGKKTTNNRTLYKVEPTIGNFIQGAVLGPSSFSQAQDYYNKKGKSKLQTEMESFK